MRRPRFGGHSLFRNWARGELLAFDLETTGVDRWRDVPVSYALVRVRRGEECASAAALVDPGCEIPPEATAVHGITTDRARRNGVALAVAVEDIVAALVDASRRGVPVVGMKLDFDLTIIDVLSRRLTGLGLAARGFRGPVVDVLVLDRHVDRYRGGPRTLASLCRHYGVTLDGAHDAEVDAVAAAQVAAAMSRRFRRIRRRRPEVLHAAQEGWHRAWASSYDQWRRREGLDPLAAHEFSWPIGRSAGSHEEVGSRAPGVDAGSVRP